MSNEHSAHKTTPAQVMKQLQEKQEYLSDRAGKNLVGAVIAFGVAGFSTLLKRRVDPTLPVSRLSLLSGAVGVGGLLRAGTLYREAGEVEQAIPLIRPAILSQFPPDKEVNPEQLIKQMEEKCKQTQYVGGKGEALKINGSLKPVIGPDGLVLEPHLNGNKTQPPSPYQEKCRKSVEILERNLSEKPLDERLKADFVNSHTSSHNQASRGI